MTRQRMLWIPAIGLSSLTLVGCAIGHSLPEPDASGPETDASGPETDASSADASILSSNTALASLSLVYPDDGLPYPQAPVFDEDTSIYTVYVGPSLDEIRMIATPANPEASITVTVDDTPVEAAAGEVSESIELDRGVTLISIVVTAPGAEKTYPLKVTRASEVVQQAYIKANTASYQFGWSVSLSGNTLAVGTPSEGTVDIFIRTIDGSWSWQDRLEADPGDRSFGWAISLSGDTLAVGAPAEGTVYVFTRSNGVWSEPERIGALNPGSGDGFGYTVSLSGDTLAIGAPFEDSEAKGVYNTSFDADDSATDSGAVYLFTRSSEGWSQQAYIKASNTGERDNFGNAISLSDDTLAVGVSAEDGEAEGVYHITDFADDNSATDSGAVYLFTQLNGDWSQQAYIKAPTVNEYRGFGYAVSLSGDTLAVSTDTARAYALTGGTDARVYIYARTDEEWWEQDATIRNPDNLHPLDDFGSAVSLSRDHLAVAASYGGDEHTGVVYVFSRSSSGEWLLTYLSLNASNGEEEDNFGNAVSLSGDILAVGAYKEDNSATGVYDNRIFSDDNSMSNIGAVYLFQ